ncbi:hypothetical protein [Aestuariibaculum marinum]|uniref:Uncharacterized protein n=1 Tax=Aestuariibaculum marinum TaxID=2683592 RepID=A0A8J6PYN1_9FLAO|nr:hypothetical protein [Aestuariibaculum marinum]MBD0824461.1 hypothetical protein [Aestuariibaculum marinum]
MTNKVFILFFSLFMSLPASSQNDSITAISELQKLNNFFGYHVQMNVVREGSIVSLPNERIEFNINEIDKIISSKNEIVRSYVIRFIVAHEFAHQIQYYAYRNHPNFMNDDLISRTIIETQADIMGCFMLWYANFELFDLLSTNLPLLNEISNELLQVALEIGSKEYTIGTHPSKRDRALAFRLGSMNGLSYVYDQRVKNSSTAVGSKGELTPEIFHEQMDYILEFIDLKKDKEDIISWSYRQAKKLLNYDRKIASDIILITPKFERHSFNTGDSHPFAYYDLTYMNVGNKTIDIDMEVYMSLVKREDLGSAKSYRKLNVNHYKFSLNPNETYRIQDKLRWDRGENDIHNLLGMGSVEMPKIVYPAIGSQDAIYSCVYKDERNNSKVYQEDISFLNLSVDKESVDFLIYINTILNACLFQDKNIVQGIGEKNLFLDNTLLYDCSLKFGEKSRTTVLTDLQRNILSVDLDFTNYYPRRSDVFSDYIDIKRLLTEEFSDCQIEEGNDSDGAWVTFNCDSYEIYVEVSADDKEKEYSLSVEIGLK